MNRRSVLAVLVAVSHVVSCAHRPTSTTSSYVDEPVYAHTEIPDRSPSSDDPWTDWSTKNTVSGLLVLKRIRDGMLKNNLHDPHVNYSGYKSVDCTKVDTNFRTADGTCYDTTRPHVGAAGVAFGRNVPTRFIDKNASKNLMTPNPTEVSDAFFTRDEFKPVPFLNMIAAVWIQFMNHDWLTHGPNEERRPFQVPQADGSSVPVDRTKVNPASSRQYKSDYGRVTLNDVTHWWDASQLYGSSQDEQNQLRTFQAGKMKTEVVNNRELLPRRDGSQFNPLSNRQNQGHELTGFMDNWWVGLSMLHTLFVKEHNAIADMLYKKYVKTDAQGGLRWVKEGERLERAPVFNQEKLDEHIFQLARLVNSAILAKIHTVEWTPAILQNPTLIRAMCANWYGLANPKCLSGELGKLPKSAMPLGPLNAGYLVGGIVGDKTNDYGVPFSITEEFTSVYRLHSLLPENLELRKLRQKRDVAAVPFAETRNDKSYAIMESYGLDDLYYSFGVQLPGQLVLNNFPAFMQNLEIPGYPKMDLGMVDIVRDRERGVPRYNQFRRAIGLTPINSYTDFFPAALVPADEAKKLSKSDLSKREAAEQARRNEVLAKFYKVYGKDAKGNDNVEMIDLLVGTLAEEVRPVGFGFGETMFQIFILMASRRLMADKFFTTHFKSEYYTVEGLKWVDETTLGSVIVRHMPQLRRHVNGLSTAFAPWNP